MKLRFLFLFFAVVFFTITPVFADNSIRERQVRVLYADFTIFPDMWISPNQCPVAHDILGELYITIYPKRIKKEKRPILDPVYTKAQVTDEYLYEVIPYDELVAEAVKQAKIKGANGISNLRIIQDKEFGNWEIQGLCIVIK